jgi:hypothetical protein
MSSKEDTPCDSNDYQLSLYSSLMDDDEYILNILPCLNATAENGGVNSGVVINGQDGTVDGVISSGGGGESSVETTVPSRTTPIWEPAVEEGDGSVNWETTAVPTTTESTSASQATTTVEVTTTPTEPLFSTVAAEAEVDSSNSQGNDSVANPQTGSDKPNNDITSSDKESDNSPSESAAQTETGETIHQETSRESTFYTCHPNPSALQSGDLAPEDTAAAKIQLIYDYELITSVGIDLTTELVRLENDMTEDLANRYGLVDCSAKLRRALRNQHRSREGVVALDSDPMDEVLDSQCEFVLLELPCGHL